MCEKRKINIGKDMKNTIQYHHKSTHVLALVNFFVDTSQYVSDLRPVTRTRGGAHSEHVLQHIIIILLNPSETCEHTGT